MIADIGTIMWKEWKEILLQGGRWGGKWNLLLSLVAFGIFLPWQFGSGWVTSPFLLTFWAWVPLFMVIAAISDAFAGERERHTLETLLASRLSDRAILFGKIGAAVSYGWGMVMASMLLSLVTVNLVHRHGKLLLYSLPVGTGIVLVSLLLSWLASGIGVLISLRAATVRQAMQTLNIAILILVFAPVLGLQALPSGIKQHLATFFGGLGTLPLGLAILAGLILLNIGLLMAAMARFRRSRLILD